MNQQKNKTLSREQMWEVAAFVNETIFQIWTISLTNNSKTPEDPERWWRDTTVNEFFETIICGWIDKDDDLQPSGSSLQVLMWHITL